MRYGGKIICTLLLMAKQKPHLQTGIFQPVGGRHDYTRASQQGFLFTPSHSELFSSHVNRQPSPTST